MIIAAAGFFSGWDSSFSEEVEKALHWISEEEYLERKRSC